MRDYSNGADVELREDRPTIKVHQIYPAQGPLGGRRYARGGIHSVVQTKKTETRRAAAMESRLEDTCLHCSPA